MTCNRKMFESAQNVWVCTKSLSLHKIFESAQNIWVCTKCLSLQTIFESAQHVWVCTKCLNMTKLSQTFEVLYRTATVFCAGLRLSFTSEIKVSVHQIRKIGGYLVLHYFSSLVLVCISPLCLEPLGLTKNRIISICSSFQHQI